MFYTLYQSKGLTQSSFTSKLLETKGTHEIESAIKWAGLALYTGETRCSTLPPRVRRLLTGPFKVEPTP